ncbi:hypothetical protein K7432_014547 [Basidiobolus ranarum]|uniref:Uncharacterized protein n=1 Tax=Basidiobolus ranarum TaxID=34480 RepID=A0ABR2WHE2_9FUNG
MGITQARSPRKDFFTPERYPDLIIKAYGENAICSHGNIILLAKTSTLCLQDMGCFTLDKDRKIIQQTLAELKRTGNEVWPVAPWSTSLSYRVDPSNTNLKDWPGKGKKATCKYGG